MNDVVYKITEAGTYYTHKNNIGKLYNHLESNKLKSQQSMEPIAQSTYRVTDDIYFYDSYRRNEHLEDIYLEDATGGSGGSGGSSSSGSSQNDDSFIPYSDIAWHSFDAKTWAGKAFQSLFGRSRAHNRTFSSKRRIRVNLYSVDFKVYAGIGLNVKYQKKNWIGWSETSCQELIWGWEGIEYEYKLN